MKGILEFNLDDQDDEVAYMRCIKARDMALALFDMDQELRRLVEHGNLGKDKYEVVDAMRFRLREIMGQYNINLDDLLI